MLIEFSVENYLSFKERQTLSLVANKREKAVPGNVLSIDIPGMSGVKLLNGVVIYGANASGKSNLLLALGFMMTYVTRPPDSKKPNEPTGVVPFRLSSASENSPSQFEVLFIHDGVRYQYGFALDSTRITAEWLYAHFTSKGSLIFERNFDSETGDYTWEFGSYFRDDEKLREKTRPNVLFLTVGASWNDKILNDAYQWFDEKLGLLDLTSSGSFPAGYTGNLLLKAPDLNSEITRILRTADLGIDGIRVERLNAQAIADAYKIPESIRDDLFKSLEGAEALEIHTTHRRTEGDGTVEFDLDDESTGTVKFFSLLGPWIDLREQEMCAFFDELGSSMHPHLTQALIRLFNSYTENGRLAQLITTTHDTTLLDSGLFRRDQIWITEKDSSAATRLFPLTDFKPRKQEALQRGYLSGRYGGIPMLSEDLR